MNFMPDTPIQGVSPLLLLFSTVLPPDIAMAYFHFTQVLSQMLFPDKPFPGKSILVE